MLTALSSALGWAYFLCWGSSLYPPILLNRRLKSVEGVSLDFALMNGLGYLTYTTSVCLLYYNGTVRAQYADRHKDGPDSSEPNYPLIRFNDVAYGVHGAILVSVLLFQIYGTSYTRGPRQRLGRFAKTLLAAMVCICILFSYHAWSVKDTPHPYQLVDVAMGLGNVKVVMSTAKYIPQIAHNHQRRTTKGWSMSSVHLDIAGGVLSLLQLVLDGYMRHDIKGIFNNSVKLALSLVTMLFNCIFMFQHYVLYGAPEQLPEVIALSTMEHQ
uniref:ARAD1C07480p n=1 Tax=Blastobotrys adeninivorans TaxID=409370 RepID=A0A060SZW5_BLAAD